MFTKITEFAFTDTPVTDVNRAQAFYEGIPGFKPTMAFAWLESDIDGLTGA